MFHRAFMVLGASIVSTLFATSVSASDLDISELIAGMKQAIIQAQKTAAPPYMIIPWLEAEISYIVKKEGEGGFKMYVVTAEAKYATEAVQRVKVRVEPPRDTKWKAQFPGEFKDAFISGVDRKAKKVFIIPTGDLEKAIKDIWAGVTVPIKVTADTKISDTSGKSKTLAEVHEGITGTINYFPEASGQLEAKTLIIKEDFRKIR